MAKRKKHRKTGTHRRRRVSGVHPVIMQTLEVVGGAGLGAVAGVFVNQAVKSSFTTAPAWSGGAACIVLGGALPLFIKPSPLIMGISAGLAGTGVMFGLNETVISLPGISGLPANPMLGNGRPGFVSQTVGNMRRMMPPGGRMGNLSGSNTMAIGSLFDN